MPELPEVEAVRRVIEPQIQGLAIEQIIVKRPEVVAHPTVNEFCCRLRGQICDRVVRRGKFLVIMLKSGDRIIIHLRMTGCLLLTPTDYPEEKHTHIILRLNSNKELRFSDTRRFGRFWLLQKGEADTYSGIEKLGKEPLAPDFTAEYLSARLGKRKKSRLFRIVCHFLFKRMTCLRKSIWKQRDGITETHRFYRFTAMRESLARFADQRFAAW